ncbi:MAG: VCBS repeat-containing protein [Isosphaeraceae bacterium]|nr:VCBS repeat-containing protein [Isosphaeraceae bacterium]
MKYLNKKNWLFSLAISLCSLGPYGESSSSAADLRFERTVIDADLPGGYQVEVADVNGDGKPDVVALGGGTCAWYENPTWKKRIITGPQQTPGIISSATTDLDGDGKAEVAIAYEFAMNEPRKGKLLLASQGAMPDDPWTLTPIVAVGSIHRLRWGEFNGDKRPDLVVAPIFGPEAKPPDYGDPARLAILLTGDDPKAGRWKGHVIARRPVLHAIEVSPYDIESGRRSVIFTADTHGVALIRLTPALGVSLRSLIPGAGGKPPKGGSSEVHLGRLKDGRFFIATIDPWHGSEVAVCLAREPRKLENFAPRTVLDDTLADGHALWVADVDRDGDDEVFAGHRGADHRVSLYDFDGQSWHRTVLDREIAAQDLRGGDLDGDGTPDVVAVGGKTHNVVWYRPIKEGEAPR